MQRKREKKTYFLFFFFFFLLLFFWYNYRRLWTFILPFIFFQLSFVTGQCGLQFSSRGVRPGITTVLARHLDKNTMGYLQWRWGIQSSMNTSIVRDTKSSHFTFVMQVGSQRLNLITVPAKTSVNLQLLVKCVSKKKEKKIQNYFFPFPTAWHSSHVCDDELSIQVPRRWPDKD